MADGSRDQTLVDFQQFTGIDDLDTCIAILEQNDWNLQAAVNSIMHPVDGGSPTFVDPMVPQRNQAEDAVQHDAGFSMEGLDKAPSRPLQDPASASGPSTPSTSFITPKSPYRMLHLIVQYRNQNIPIALIDTETVGKIKEILQEELTIPVESQELKGLVKRKVDDKTVLRDLNLAQNTTIFLLTPSIPGPTINTARNNQEEMMEAKSDNYTLVINFTLDQSKYKTYSLHFPASKTIKEVKQDLVAVTDVPVRHQSWSGWPDNCQDDMKLSEVGINETHHLELSKLVKPSTSRESQDVPVEVSSDEEDGGDSMMLEEEDFQETRSVSRNQPLMPENAGSETEALEHFTREFRSRYGECLPVFYIGSLDNAIRDSLQGRARERKMLAIYLHDDNSIFSNVFCSQLLCAESIVDYLSSNFIIWAWDLSFSTNRNRVIAMATQHFGSVAASQIRSYKSEQLPALLLINRNRATNEVVDMIQGHVSLDELMTRLIHAHMLFQQQQEADIKEEEERDARERIKQEQDQAYQDSLAADRAKAEAQREVEMQQQQEREAEMHRQMVEEQRKQEEAAIKEAIAQSIASELPDEPPSDCPDPVSTIRFKTPTGEFITRRFLASQKLKILLDFLTSRGFHMEEFKVLTTFPRRDISTFSQDQSLQELKLYPQETLILEEKH